MKEIIAIVIPIYKEEKYLPKTLESLTQQTIIKDCEIILSEYNPDKSPFTKNLIKKFHDKHGISIKLKDVPRSGIAYQRNEGVLMTSAPYFCNFDADSKFKEKDALERLIKPLTEGYMLTICDLEFDYVGLNNKELEDMILPQQSLDVINKAQRMGFPVLEPGSCFNKTAFVEVGGFNDIRRAELSMMALRFLWRFPNSIKHVPVSVITSTRRHIKLNEMGLEALDYNNAIREKGAINIK